MNKAEQYTDLNGDTTVYSQQQSAQGSASIFASPIYPSVHFAGDNYSDEEENQTEISVNTFKRQEQARRKLSTESGVSTAKTFLIILKSFVCTGVLFLPNAFSSAGIVLASVSMLVLAPLSYYCMSQLVLCKRKVGGTYGMIGEQAYGKIADYAVQVSIVISQAGVGAAYVVFVADILDLLLSTIFQCSPSYQAFPKWGLMVAELIVYIPLLWIRRVKALAIPSLISDVFIVAGLGMVMYYSIKTISEEGISNIIYYSVSGFPLFFGTSVYVYEGMAIILPIEESMKNKKHFLPVLGISIALVAVSFVVFACLVYMAFGQRTMTIALLNLPASEIPVQIVEALYIVVVILTFPLMLLPVVRILEHILFPRKKLVGKKLGLVAEGTERKIYEAIELPIEHQQGRISWEVTWQKNAFRAFLAVVLVIVGIIGSSELDSFVSMIGSLCMIPLAFIYPPLFHYKLVATTTFEKVTDLVILVFGVLSMIMSTIVSVWQWIFAPKSHSRPCFNHSNTWNETIFNF